MRRSSSSEGALTCAVCMEGYNEGEHRPLLLPACGHTFCKLCLTGVLTKEGIKGQLLCPTCRRPQPVISSEDLPSNYSLLELTRKEGSFPSSSPGGPTALALPDTSNMKELCSEHGSRLAFWCTTCEVAACGECLFEGHSRPQHNLARVDEHLTKIQELMNRRSTRIITQLTAVSEENVNKVKDALVAFIELLRQKRVLKKLLDESHLVRLIAQESSDLGSLSSVNETLRSLEKEFKNAQIDSEITVSIKDPFGFKSSSPGKSQVSPPAIDADHKAKPEDLVDLEPTVLSPTIESTVADNSSQPPGAIASFPDPLEESPPASTPAAIGGLPAPLRPAKPTPGSKPPLLARPPVGPKPRVAFPSTSALPITKFKSTYSLHASQSNPGRRALPNVSTSQSQTHSSLPETISVSTQTISPSSSSGALYSLSSEHQDVDSQSKSKSDRRTIPDSPAWPSMLCGTLSGNWTASKITLEPRGIHVYSLEPMKEKCDVFLNFSLVSSLAPVRSPTVFMDLQEGSRPLGRVYITLQIHLPRGQQFFSLCLGDKGPSYQGSFFHSILRRGESGEGLAGGDYNNKAGKGGSAVLTGLDPNKEMAKRCERGMVSRLTTRTETAAQFCITIRDGPRTKTVFPFGRVCQGINVVEEACRRPALSISVANCGCVLPLQ